MAYWIQNNKEELNAALTRSGLNARVSGIHAHGGSWQSSRHIRFSAGYAPDNDAHDEEVHFARHTFATTICLENGLPIETVSKILENCILYCESFISLQHRTESSLRHCRIMKGKETHSFPNRNPFLLYSLLFCWLSERYKILKSFAGIVRCFHAFVRQKGASCAMNRYL